MKNYTRRLFPLLAVLSVLPGLAGCDSDNVGGGTASYTLTVSKAGTGTGAVTGSAGGTTVIDCGVDCAETAAQGTVITLSVLPTAGNTFGGWAGACTGAGACQITMDGDRQVTAIFNPPGTGGACGAPAGVVAVTSSNLLISFNQSSPSIVQTQCPITGLNTGETVLGIDYRPFDGLLYGVSSQNRLFTIATGSGATSGHLTLTAAAGDDNPFTAIGGTNVGVDFNPQADALRVVVDSATGQNNLRINPTNGQVTTDTTVPAGISAAAYSNNSAGATGTVLFVMNTSTDKLMIQDPPAAGTLTEVGAFGRDITGVNGFEIVGTGATSSQGAIAVAKDAAGANQFFTVDLVSGALTLVGSIPVGDVRGLSVVPVAGQGAPGDTFALTAARHLISFNRAAPSTILSRILVQGIASGYSIVGMDFRPTTRALHVLAKGTGPAKIYTVNVLSGLATFVADVTADPAEPVGCQTENNPNTCSPTADPKDRRYAGLSGTSFGLAFDSTRDDRPVAFTAPAGPVLSSLVVVSNASEHVRIDVTTGLADARAPLHRSGTATQQNPDGEIPALVTAVAFINDFAYADRQNSSSNTNVVRAYVIDTTTDRLGTLRVIRNATGPVPAGRITDVGTGLGVDAEAVGAFEIDGLTGTGYAALRVGGVNRLFTISLTAGTASDVAATPTIGDGTEDLVGLALVPPQVTTVFGLITEDGKQKLIKFRPYRPGTLLPFTSVTGSPDRAEITGLAADEIVLGLEFNGLTGKLYAVTRAPSFARVIEVNPDTGATSNGRTLVADPNDLLGAAPFSLATFAAATDVAIDADPRFQSDTTNSLAYLRAATDNDMNMRINPSTGGVFTDTNISPSGVNLQAMAFINNRPGVVETPGAIDTILWGFDDAGQGTLYRIDTPEDITPNDDPETGVADAVTDGFTGIFTPDSTGATDAGFDIAGGHNGASLLVVVIGGRSTLFHMSTSLGDTIEYGVVGPATPVLPNVRGLAIQLVPGTVP